ncbi:MAG TPA: hypothetical protein GXX75_17245 [Clostridiales bacterium]|nr:hypothetical protein [Clostridiales bacterium]
MNDIKSKQFSLLSQISKATSLQQIVDLAYEALGNPFFINDRAHVILAHTKVVYIDDPHWLHDIATGGKVRKPILHQKREMDFVYLGSVKDSKPVIVTDSDLPFPRIIKALVVRGVHVGNLVMTTYFKPIQENDIEVIDIISSFVANHLRNEHYFLSDNEHAKDNYFLRLLNGEKSTPESLMEHAKLLNWSKKQENYVIAMCSLDTELDETQNLKMVLDDFNSLPNCHSLFYHDRIICILSSDYEINTWETEVANLHALIIKWNLVAGVSQGFQSLQELRKHYLQADKMIDISTVLKKGIRFYVYDEYAVYHLMSIVPSGTNLKEFCHEKILALEAYDIAHNTVLVPTLHVYLENLKSVNKTAELMFIHRNTVSYRINKCMELMNTQMEDGTEIFSFIFSLRIMEYYNKLNII